MRERATLRARHLARMHGDATRLKLLARAAAEVVVGERGEEKAGAGEIRELDGRDGPAARGLLPRLGGVDDLARRGDVIHPGELHPLDVADHGHPDVRRRGVA